MCGIFGIIANNADRKKVIEYNKILNELSILSETRGKESSGTVYFSPAEKSFTVIKSIQRYSKLIKSKEYKEIQDRIINSYNGSAGNYIAFGHSRLVTNGSRTDHRNNQPVVNGNSITVHNGIIVNYKEIFEQLNYTERQSELDTEVIPVYIDNYLSSGQTLEVVLNCMLQNLKGTISMCAVLPDVKKLVLLSNIGSLYYIKLSDKTLIFASEKFIIEKLLLKYTLVEGIAKIFQLKSEFLLLDLNLPELNHDEKYTINNVEDTDEIIKNADLLETFIDINMIKHFDEVEEKMLENNWEKIKNLRRCSKCLLPETFPFINFDNQGVCNYCLNYVSGLHDNKENELKEIVEKYKTHNGNPDCLIPFSGGRDSSYVLHYVTKELGLKPLTLTYDWGMVTDLARRNIARVCGKLGVENIIVSADIVKKRRFIRKNILAWLRNPQLGMIPLFMAGDKYFFYHTSKLKKDTGIKLNIWGINPLENTNFKVGFAGIPPEFIKDKIYSLKLTNHFRLYGYFLINYLRNNHYLNESYFDTVGSYMVRFFFPKKDYYTLFDFMKWDEEKIVSTIVNEYEWETAIDTNSTWRIGDGTAPFYNYIYYTVAGFNEFDTFRSNQIREGLITREEGMKLIENDNKPRYKSMKWYLDILSLDFRNVIERINNIPKLYEL